MCYNAQKSLENKQKERKMIEESIVTVGPANENKGLLVIVLAKKAKYLSGNTVTLFVAGKEVMSKPVLQHPYEIDLIKDPSFSGSAFGHGIGYAVFDIDLSTISNRDSSVVLSKGSLKKAPVKVCV